MSCVEVLQFSVDRRNASALFQYFTNFFGSVTVKPTSQGRVVYRNGKYIKWYMILRNSLGFHWIANWLFIHCKSKRTHLSLPNLLSSEAFRSVLSLKEMRRISIILHWSRLKYFQRSCTWMPYGFKVTITIKQIAYQEEESKSDIRFEQWCDPMSTFYFRQK